MRRIGTVVRVVGGIAVARAPAPADRRSADGDEPPAVGTTVVDEELTGVGEVVTVFGPVEQPYVGIATGDGPAPASLVGEPVYER